MIKGGCAAAGPAGDGHPKKNGRSFAPIFVTDSVGSARTLARDHAGLGNSRQQCEGEGACHRADEIICGRDSSSTLPSATS